MMNIPFTKYSKLWATLSSLIMIVCIALVFRFGLKPGIDFTGGSLLEVSFSRTTPEQTDVEALLAKLNIRGEAVQQLSSGKALLIRTPFLPEAEHQRLIENIRIAYQKNGNLVQEDRFETIGSTVSSQLKSRAFWAIILVNLGIILYIAYAFRRVSRPVASWKYGALAILALIHDVFLVLAVFAVFGTTYGTEVDIAFVVAILTILGYSVNDTVVVYDRIRENLFRRTANESFSDVVNAGLNQTVARSINTTFTTLIPLFALYFFGGQTIHNFSLALLIGIASGAYSSIFVAAPFLVLVEAWQRRSVGKKP